MLGMEKSRQLLDSDKSLQTMDKSSSEMLTNGSQCSSKTSKKNDRKLPVLLNANEQSVEEPDDEIITFNATFAEMGTKLKNVVVKDSSLIKIEKHYPPVPLKTPAELKEWGNFPPKVSCFVERPKKIEELNEAFEQAGGQPVVLSAACLSAAALQRLGGIGKTQLATDYVQNEAIMSRYVFCAWFNAETEEQLEREYISLGQMAGIIAIDDKTTQQEKMEIVKRWLSHKENYGWLLVYDNVTEATSVKKYIPSKGGHVLITSRKATWVDAKVIEVPLFTDEEARELIVRQSGCEAEEPALTNLIEELGHLPLALAQAGAYIKMKLRYSATPIAEYLSLYLSNKPECLEDDILRKEALQDIHPSVYVTFEMNFRELPPESLQTLYHCGLLTSEPIPMNIIKESMKVGIQKEDKGEEVVKDNIVFDEILERSGSEIITHSSQCFSKTSEKSDKKLPVSSNTNEQSIRESDDDVIGINATFVEKGKKLQSVAFKSTSLVTIEKQVVPQTC